MRDDSGYDLPPLDRGAPDPIILQRKYRLLTPLFGGGVEAGKVDETLPVRGTTIRGQLRFWWRATRGGQFADVAAMKAGEAEVWGATDRVSPVTITVLRAGAGSVYNRAHNNRGEPVPIGEPASDHSYVAFPLKSQRPTDKSPGREAGEVHERVTFTLRIAFPADLSFDVQAALWAWDTFGGVGARTRRGFGALECFDVQPEAESAPADPADWRWAYPGQEVAARLDEHAKHFVSTGQFPDGVPHLSRDPQRYRALSPRGDAVVAWKYLFDKLKEFRQDRRPPGRDGRPGRSYWPEPDAIRHLTLGSRIPADREPIYTPRLDRFPRAAFGLPIVFQFKSERNGPQEPGQTELQGRNHDRLASPLILRPLACEGGFVPLALVLNGPRPWDASFGGVMLKGATGNSTVHAELTVAEAAAIATHTKHYQGNPDVLQDFLDSL